MAFPSNATEWSAQVTAAVGAMETAGYILVPIIAALMIGAFWLGSKISGAGKESLREQVSAARAESAALEQRRQLAADKEQSLTAALQESEAKINSLNLEIASAAQTIASDTGSLLIDTGASVRTSFDDVISANNALRSAIRDKIDDRDAGVRPRLDTN